MLNQPQLAALDRIDVSEQELLTAFLACPVLRRFAQLSRVHALEVLLQRRFVSLAITPLYDMAIDAVEDAAARRCLREILREEYPANDRPTHREDLVHDLHALGASWEQIVSTAISGATAHSIKRLFAALRKEETRDLYEVKTLSLVRFAGEVLVSAEYESIWPALRALGLRTSGESGGTASRFYEPHMRHDARVFRFGEQNRRLGRRSHSDQLTELLRTRVLAGGAAALEYCIRSMELAAQIKGDFYEQFSPLLGSRPSS